MSIIRKKLFIITIVWLLLGSLLYGIDGLKFTTKTKFFWYPTTDYKWRNAITELNWWYNDTKIYIGFFIIPSIILIALSLSRKKDSKENADSYNVAQVSAVTDASYKSNNRSKHAGFIFWKNNSENIHKSEVYYDISTSLDNNEAELISIFNTLRMIKENKYEKIWLFTDSMSSVNFLKDNVRINDKYIHIVNNIKSVINEMKMMGTEIDISWKSRSNKKIQELNKRV